MDKIYNIQLTEEELDKIIVQIGVQLDYLKSSILNEKDYNAISNRVAHISAIQSGHDKLMEARYR